MQFKWNGGRIARAVRMTCADELERLGRMIVRELKAVLNKYFPPASKPGKPPRRRSGKLRDSVTFSVNRTTLTLNVFVEGVEYWFYLEFGTSKMEARPFLRPYLRKNDKRINAAIAEAVRKAIRREGRK